MIKKLEMRFSRKKKKMDKNKVRAIKHYISIPTPN